MFISVGWLAGYFKTLYHPVMLWALQSINRELTLNCEYSM